MYPINCAENEVRKRGKIKEEEIEKWRNSREETFIQEKEDAKSLQSGSGVGDDDIIVQQSG